MNLHQRISLTRAHNRGTAPRPISLASPASGAARVSIPKVTGVSERVSVQERGWSRLEFELDKLKR